MSKDIFKSDGNTVRLGHLASVKIVENGIIGGVHIQTSSDESIKLITESIAKLLNEMRRRDMIWKIIEYSADGTQYKKRMGDTEQGLSLAKRAADRGIRKGRRLPYKLFTCTKSWTEVTV